MGEAVGVDVGDDVGIVVGVAVGDDVGVVVGVAVGGVGAPCKYKVKVGGVGARCKVKVTHGPVLLASLSSTDAIVTVYAPCTTYRW